PGAGADIDTYPSATAGGYDASADLASRRHTPGMKRLVWLVGVAAVAVSSAGASTHATLRLADSGPVVLRGAGFAAGEHVRVSVVTGAEHAAKRLTARPTGRFTVRFASLDANACAAFGARAIGDKGSRAIYKRAPGMCPAP